MNWPSAAPTPTAARDRRFGSTHALAGLRPPRPRASLPAVVVDCALRSTSSSRGSRRARPRRAHLIAVRRPGAANNPRTSLREPARSPDVRRAPTTAESRGRVGLRLPKRTRASPALPSMVRKGSTVRVRQRAYSDPQFCWGHGRAAVPEGCPPSRHGRYAKCIRAHGVPNFPDPTSQGLRISPSSGRTADTATD